MAAARRWGIDSLIFFGFVGSANYRCVRLAQFMLFLSQSAELTQRWQTAKQEHMTRHDK